MPKDVNLNPEGKDNQDDKLDKNLNESEQLDIKDAEISKTLGDFAEQVSDNPEVADNTVNENVDFSEISGEIASKVRKNVDVDKPVEPKTTEEDLNQMLEIENPSKLDEFLGDVGITRRQLYIFLAIILCFVIGVILSFYYLLSLFSSTPDDITNEPDEPLIEEPVVDEGPGLWDRISEWFSGNEEEPTDEEPSEPVVEEPVENKDDGIGGVGDVGSIGRDELERLDSEAIELMGIVGMSNQSQSKIGRYLDTYRKLRSVFNTDLFAYLSVVNDREAAYENYVLNLRGNYESALMAQSDLEEEINQYLVRLNALELELEAVEVEFFGEVEALNSSRVSELLGVFQELGRREVVLTSELKARQAILDRYNGIESIVTDRITAIELNREAFIQGVRVVDYRNVDLDLIIDGQ